MPRRDGTGPQGRGPMTGRNMGPCNRSLNSQVPLQSYVNIAGQILNGIFKVVKNKKLQNQSFKQIEKY